MNLRHSRAIARNDFQTLRADPTFFVAMVVMPIVVMAFVKPSFRYTIQAAGLPSGNGAEQAVPGMAVMFGMFLVGNLGFSVLREHGWGTWERLRGSFATPGEILLGKSISPITQSVTQLAVLFVVGVVVFDLHIRGSVFALVAVAGAFCVAIVGLALVILATCKSVMQLNAASNIGALMLSGLGGAIAPLYAMPSWARHVAPIAPTYWAMRGFNTVIIHGGGVDDVVTPVAVLCAFGLGSAVVGRARFRMEETRAAWA